jgi:hypothetical protein
MIAVAFTGSSTAPALGEVSATVTTTTPLVALAERAAAPGLSLLAAAVMLATSRTTIVEVLVASKAMLGGISDLVTIDKGDDDDDEDDDEPACVDDARGGTENTPNSEAPNSAAASADGNVSLPSSPP